jgi:hypothetical protein
MDDKEQYINTLKSLTTSKVKKIKVESKEQILLENGPELPSADQMYKEFLNELFVQAGEIEAIAKGKERDTQILRLGMIAELDAVNLYDKLALLASDKRVKALMLDVSREEKVHAGEFETLMEEIDPDYEEAEEEGEEEVEDLMKKI